MTNKYQKQKEARKRYQNFSEQERKNAKKKLDKDIKILQKKKKKKGVIRIFLMKKSKS